MPAIPAVVDSDDRWPQMVKP